MRLISPAILASSMLLGSVVAASAQDTPTEDLIDPEVPQQERICDMEIDEVEALLDENIEAFGRLEQSRLQQQLDEAQEFCDSGNEVMAAIRLEAVMAVIEVSGVAE